MKIKIEWLVDNFNDCGHAGCSGGYAEGANVWFDNKLEIKLLPQAGCYGGDSWDESEVYKKILEKLGHEVKNASSKD